MRLYPGQPGALSRPASRDTASPSQGQDCDSGCQQGEVDRESLDQHNLSSSLRLYPRPIQPPRPASQCQRPGLSAISSATRPYLAQPAARAPSPLLRPLASESQSDCLSSMRPADSLRYYPSCPGPRRVVLQQLPNREIELDRQPLKTN